LTMFSRNKTVSPKRSIPALIGGLSVCLLLAGSEPLLDRTFREIWWQIGALGLVAAVGLSLVEQAKLAVARGATRKSQRRIDRRLSNTAAQCESLTAIAQAVHRICRDGAYSGLNSPEEDSEVNKSRSPTVQLRSLGLDRSWQGSGTACALTASVRSLSPTTVKLLHNHQIAGSRFSLQFTLQSGETTILLAELLWQDRLADGPYFSAGKLTEILTTDGATELDSAATQSNRAKPGDPPAQASLDASSAKASGTVAEREEVAELPTPATTEGQRCEVPVPLGDEHLAALLHDLQEINGSEDLIQVGKSAD
jgi:hypothetical protein